MEKLVDHIWLLFMSASIVAKGVAPAFPHFSGPLGAVGDTMFSLACLFASPQAALKLLQARAPKPPEPAEPVPAAA